jgi:hypothetical protein
MVTHHEIRWVVCSDYNWAPTSVEFNSNVSAHFFKRSTTIIALVTIIQRLDKIAISKGAQYNNTIIDILDKSQKLKINYTLTTRKKFLNVATPTGTNNPAENSTSSRM